jgi:isopentenyl diphosphate isomerase/L-lactate dehydrogenase-like FMN-dependent dehydrogenase
MVSWGRGSERILADCYNIHDLREAAARRLPKVLFEFVDMGSEDGVALRRNREAFEQIMLDTKFLVDVSSRDLSVDLFGRRSALPIAIAPTGLAGMLWRDGEVALAKAAAKFGIPFILSMSSVSSIEDIARRVDGRHWFQIYMWREKEYNYEMIRRVRDLGIETLVVTIDSALGRNREHNDRNGLGFPFRPNIRALRSFATKPGWCANVMLPFVAGGRIPVHANLPEIYQQIVHFRLGQPSPSRFEAMTWDEIAAIRDLWPRTLIIKSILSVSQAEQAVAHGADGIVVSNHGGRSLDSAPPTISVLPRIAAAVGNRATLLLDSGIRRGSDIAKALALGAKATLIGRATLYGVAAAGEAGADKAISILRDEFEKTLGYIGCPKAADVSPDSITQTGTSPLHTPAGV